MLNDVIDNGVTDNDVIDSWMNIHTLLASIGARSERSLRHLATSRESRRMSMKVHFGLSWVRPWDYRGKCYMEQGGQNVLKWRTFGLSG